MRVSVRVSSLIAVIVLSGEQRMLGQAATPLPPEAAANPVVWSAKMLYLRDAKNMVAAADEMPEDKYGYHPTPDQWTFR